VSAEFEPLRFRKATAGDAAALSRLAFRSKAHWGYGIEFMKRCRAELTYSEAQVESDRFRFYLYEHAGEPVAFYALELENKGRGELEALFVRPDYVRMGLGRSLIAHMKVEAMRHGVRIVTIVGDPNAEDFYLAVGAVPAGYRESASIRGRQLPVFSLDAAKDR